MSGRVHLNCETFWNHKRLDCNVSQQELAELLNVSDSTISNWFVGRYMPDNEIIQKICDIFDVDFQEGYKEFYKAHDMYRGPKKMLGSKQIVSKIPRKADMCKDGVEVLSLLYGKLSYDEFLKVVESLNQNVSPLKYIYGKVSFEEYNEITNLLSEGIICDTL